MPQPMVITFQGLFNIPRAVPTAFPANADRDGITIQTFANASGHLWLALGQPAVEGASILVREPFLFNAINNTVATASAFGYVGTYDFLYTGSLASIDINIFEWQQGP